MDYTEYQDFLFRKFQSVGNDNPMHLYKYLDVDGGLKSLEYLTLQFSHPYTFEDKTEFRKSRIDFTGQGKVIRDFFYSDEVNQYGEMSFELERKINLMTDEELVDYFTETWEEEIKSLGVACFTTLEDSEFHWKHYAKNGTGICIRYELPKILKFLSNSNNFRFQGQSTLRDCPVIYVPNIHPLKFQVMDLHSKLLVSLNWCVVKSEDYASEQEFRLYSFECMIVDGYDRVKVARNSINKVYLGHNINPSKAGEIKKLGFNTVQL